jgi:hypothetical protein
MTTKSLILGAALTAIGVSFQPAVKAGRPFGSASNPTGTATVNGIVKLEGRVPKPTAINMAADLTCAKQHPTPVLNQAVIVDGSGDVQNAIVFVAEGLGERTFEPPSQQAVMDQKGCMYQPHVLAMQANQPLEIVNNDPTSHNIHPVPANNREWNKSEPPGSKTEETFTREEIAIPVKCNIHPWMRSYVAVLKHPHFAVTTEHGSFTLGNLPPGTYTLKAWHEKLGTLTQQISVGANDTKTVEFVFRPPPTGM